MSFAASVKPSASQRSRTAWRPGMAAEHQPGRGRLADVFRFHDLVGPCIFQHAVLMNPRLVREGIAADDRLVGLHRFTGHVRQQLARLEQLWRLNGRVVRQTVLTHAQRHHQFFERRVAGTLADAVDRAFNLPHAALNRRQAVGHRQAEVVVAMRAEYRPPGVRNARQDVGEELAQFVGRGVADGVRQIDGRRAGGDHLLDDAAQEIAIAAGCILRRKFDVVGKAAGQLDRIDCRFRQSSREMRSLA